jgi:hypothetical protein
VPLKLLNLLRYKIFCTSAGNSFFFLGVILFLEIFEDVDGEVRESISAGFEIINIEDTPSRQEKSYSKKKLKRF